jgi:hypothetical protein
MFSQLACKLLLWDDETRVGFEGKMGNAKTQSFCGLRHNGFCQMNSPFTVSLNGQH